jgi:hypothetical protein
MLNMLSLVTDAFIEELRRKYYESYGDLNYEYSTVIAWSAQLALEHIANSDALYHNVDHTVNVTLVGQELIRGKHMRDGGVSPKDWLHYTLALLFHDIGYVRGICKADSKGKYATGVGRKKVDIDPTGTDAALTPYHVDRGKLFVKERFGKQPMIVVERLQKYIEMTRFPPPKDDEHADTSGLPGLVRAADLIGQLGDPNYLRKMPALFYEFEETGANEKIGYKSPGDIRVGYSKFFWDTVMPYIGDALNYLRLTQEGKQWIANLHGHVFAVEHYYE